MLLKHASNVTGCALLIEKLFALAGFPSGAFTTLVVSSSRIEPVLRDPAIVGSMATASGVAGSAVAAIAGSEIKPTVLELGGSDPFVVLADADLDRAVAAAVSSRNKNSGQSCNSAKRFIVEEPVYARFIEMFAQKLRDLKVGDPRLEDTDVGPLARPDVVDKLHRQVQESVALGATILLGGEIPDGAGCYYPPTLMVDVTEDMPVFVEETFGPVAPVVMARDAEHAIELANTTEFGLGASVWTEHERGRGDRRAYRGLDSSP